MLSRRAFGMTLVVVLTVVAVHSTASAQMYGYAWPQNVRYPSCYQGVPFGYWGGPGLGHNPYSCGMVTPWQPPARRSGYLNTPEEIEQHFQRKLANIEERYGTKPAAYRARFERQKEITAIKNAYADIAMSNRARAEDLAGRSAVATVVTARSTPSAQVCGYGKRTKTISHGCPQATGERKGDSPIFAPKDCAKIGTVPRPLVGFFCSLVYAWPHNTHKSPGHYAAESPGHNPQSCGADTPCQPQTRPSDCSHAAGDVSNYFERKLTNIKYRYMIKVALYRARLERDRQLANLKREYAAVIDSNRQRAEDLARRFAPKRLSASEYDPITGTISWPSLLQTGPRFAKDRKWLDVLFAQRARSSGNLGSGNYGEIRSAIERMKSTLIVMLREGEVDGTTYTSAKSFLNSLAYEAQFTTRPAVTSIAVN